ncbi:MAG: hypothetical protein JNM10_19010, partial [Planctomycetia bacterium]|nr:hypothetical protein [Planctomycetia bacterium]
MGRTMEGPNAAGAPVAPEVFPGTGGSGPAHPARDVRGPRDVHESGNGGDGGRPAEAAPVVVEVGPLDPTARTVRVDARLDGAVVGTLTGRFPTPELFVADGITCAPGASAPAIERAFARAVATALAPRDGEALVTVPGSPPGWRAAIEAVGLVLRASKACVRRALDATLPTVTHSFTLRSLSEVGEDAFRARIELAAAGDPFEARRRAPVERHRAWRDLVASAGDRFDPTSWFLVDDADGPVGVVLPQSVGADLGTLFYVGVEPPRRGHGL